MALLPRISTILAAGALMVLPAAADAASTQVVAPGQTLSGIAAANGISTQALAAANGLSATAFVIAGSTLNVPDRATPTGSGLPAPLSGYRVRLGDTLGAIAAEHGVTIAQLAASNGLNPEGTLVVGTSLRLPARSVSTPTTIAAGTRVVSPGETLWGIAMAAGVTPAALAAANGVSVEHRVIAGTSLRIPLRGTTVSGQTTASVAAPATTRTGPVGAPGRMTAAQIGSIAAQYGVPASLATAIAWQESGFNNAMVSVANARGIMQVMPTSWNYVQNELGAGRLDPTSPMDNVRAGAILLRQLLKESGGDQAIAVAAYYQGMTSVRRIGMLPTTRQYVASVMALKARFGG